MPAVSSGAKDAAQTVRRSGDTAAPAWARLRAASISLGVRASWCSPKPVRFNKAAAVSTSRAASIRKSFGSDAGAPTLRDQLLVVSKRGANCARTAVLAIRRCQALMASAINCAKGSNTTTRVGCTCRRSNSTDSSSITRSQAIST